MTTRAMNFHFTLFNVNLQILIEFNKVINPFAHTVVPISLHISSVH